jgi:uncharacterized membrane protein
MAAGGASGEASSARMSSGATVGAAGITDNVAATLCYVLGLITGIIFLVIAPYNQSKFVRFHAFQSIFFHVAFIVVWILEGIIIATILPWMLVSLLTTVTALAALGIWILLLVKAYQGEQFRLPVIGDMAAKQA